MLVGTWPALFCALPIERLSKVRKPANHVLVKPWQFLNSRPVFNELKKMICYFSGPSRVLALGVPGGGGHCSAALSFSLTLWGQNPKPEGRSPKEIRNPKPETQNCSCAGLSFGFRASGFFRISDTDFVACSRKRSLSEFRPSDLCCPNDLRVCLERPCLAWPERQVGLDAPGFSC